MVPFEANSIVPEFDDAILQISHSCGHGISDVFTIFYLYELDFTSERRCGVLDSALQSRLECC